MRLAALMWKETHPKLWSAKSGRTEFTVSFDNPYRERWGFCVDKYRADGRVLFHAVGGIFKTRRGAMRYVERLRKYGLTKSPRSA